MSPRHQRESLARAGSADSSSQSSSHFFESFLNAIKFPALTLSPSGQIVWSNSAAARELEISHSQEIYDLVNVSDQAALHALIENPDDAEHCFQTRILCQNHAFMPVRLHLSLRRIGRTYCVMTPDAPESKKWIGTAHLAIFEAFRALSFDSLLRTLAHSLRRWAQSDFVVFCKHPPPGSSIQRVVSYSFSSAAHHPHLVLDFLQRRLTRGGARGLARACADSFGFYEALAEPIYSHTPGEPELWGHLFVFETKVSPLPSVRKLLIEHIRESAEDVLTYEHQPATKRSKRPGATSKGDFLYRNFNGHCENQDPKKRSRSATGHGPGDGKTPSDENAVHALDPSTLLANISHEIRTPLSGIAGILTLLEGTELNETQRTYIEALSRSAESMRRIVNDCFDMSGLRSKQVTLNKENVALVPLLKEIALNHRVLFEDKGIRFFVDFPVYRDIVSDVDRIRVRQIIDNLLVNARKYTATGSVTLALRQVDNEALIEIIDTGRGISDENLENIFKRFFQEEGASTSFSNGLGIGLSISKQLIDLMGGRIEVKRNESGVGSTFTVLLSKSKDTLRNQNHVSPLNVRYRYILVSEEDGLLRCARAARLEALDVLTCKPGEFTTLHLATQSENQDFHVENVLITDGLTQAMSLALRGTFQGQVTELCLRPSSKASQNEMNTLSEPFCWDDVFAKLARFRQTADSHSPSESPRHGEEMAARTTKPLAMAIAPFAPSPLLSRRVLIAEDDDVNQFVLRQYILKLGLEVDLVSDGKQALDIIEKNPHIHDVYIFDFMMPELDGVSLAKAIRKREAGLGEAKRTLIALTADASHRRAQICIEAGFDVFLTKPVRLAELRDILQKILLGKRAQRSEPCALSLAT